MDTIKKIRGRAKLKPKTIVLPEYNDARVIEASRVLEQEGIVRPLLLTKDKINPKDDVLPQVVSDFLPPSLDAKIASKGTLEKGLHLTADLDFDRYEAWHLALDQNPEKNNKIDSVFRVVLNM